MKKFIQAITYIALTGSVLVMMYISKLFRGVMNNFRKGIYSEETFSNIMTNLINTYFIIFIIDIVLFIILVLILRKLKKLP